MIRPSGISSSNRFSTTAEVNPSGVSALLASVCVPPITDGTTTFEPGPISTYQPPAPRATARNSAMNLFLRTRLLILRRLRTCAVVSFLVTLGSFTITVFSFSDLRALFFSLRDLRAGLIGSTGISSSKLIWFCFGSSAIEIFESSEWNSDASRGRWSGSGLVALKINSSRA